MSEYKDRVLQARNEFIKLNFEQEKELFKIYNDAGDRLVGKILNMTDSRTKIHNIETYKIINEYRTELFHNLNKTIENNIYKSADIQKGVQLSFVDVIAPNVKINEALKRTVTKISSDSVKQLIAGEYYKDGKTLSKRLWNITGNNGNKIDTIIKENIAKGANVKELAKELNKYVNPKNRITPKTFQDGLGGDNISYQARRLARTSITHAQTETMIQNAKLNPFCKGLKWNLSASHFSRMHGKRDECDDYNGRTYKAEEVPLQHPNCLCYFTEVLEEFDKCVESMKDWSSGKRNPDIDEWIKAGDDKTSIKINTPDKIQTKINLDTKNKKGDIIKEKNSIKQVSNFNELGEYLKDNLGINIVDDNINKLSFEAIKDTCESMEKVYNDFPQLNGFINELYTSKTGIMSCAPTDSSFKYTKISFNPFYYEKKSKIEEVYLKDANSGFHPKGTTFEISGVHELGHAVEAYLIQKEQVGILSSNYWNECTIAKSIVSDACKNAKKLPQGKGLKNVELKNNISGYALNDASECMAEAFSDYYGNGENASILSKEIMLIVKEMMK